MQASGPIRIDLLLIGAQKCATSWLYECMRDHPQMWLPAKKREVKYLGSPYYGGSYGGSPYYGSGYGYNSYGYSTRCRTVSRWDPYTRRYVRYRDC